MNEGAFCLSAGQTVTFQENKSIQNKSLKHEHIWAVTIQPTLTFSNMMLACKTHLYSQGQTTTVGKELTSAVSGSTCFHRFNLVFTEAVLLLKSYLGAEIDIANYKSCYCTPFFIYWVKQWKIGLSVSPQWISLGMIFTMCFCYQTPLRVGVKGDGQDTDKLALSRVYCQ